jgi:Tol biopolymer transport system component
MTVNLDSSNYQDLGLGDGISLSPDSRQIVYSSETGLQLMDLETRKVTPLANTWKNDRGPIWSPDGSKITFTRGPASGLIGAPGPYSIFISNTDGSQQIPVVENGDANTVMAWLPDGQTLLYTIAGPDGAMVKSINIATGTTTNNFETNYPFSNVAISPDGNQVAFEEMLPGDHYGIYTANLDGSNKKLIVDAAPIVATIPQWSPDGKWLIVSMHDENFKITPVLALIEVDNCTIIPLTTLSGYVSTWNP